MIPPRKVGDVFVKRLVYLFFYFILYYYFNYELRGVIGRAMASHAIDPGSNPGQGVLVLKGTSDITAWQCLALFFIFCQENFMKNFFCQENFMKYFFFFFVRKIS